MPHHIPRVLLAGRSQRERRQRRAGVRLRDFSITPKTKARYESAVATLLPFLEEQENLRDLDSIVADWVELQWSRGAPLATIGDCLCGLHFFWPEWRGLLRESWRLFKSWRRVEVPCRAPPLTVMLARAFIARAVHLNNLRLAALISLGFHALLRTGELLQLQFGDIECSTECGIVSLKRSKSGLRSGAQEAVALRDSLCLQILHTLLVTTPHHRGDKLWLYSAQAFRLQFKRLVNFFNANNLNFKPYSLRRGGATFLLQQGLALESILVRGRWKSIAVGRLYLEDGLAQIPSLRLSWQDKEQITLWANKTSPTTFRP